VLDLLFLKKYLPILFFLLFNQHVNELLVKHVYPKSRFRTAILPLSSGADNEQNQLLASGYERLAFHQDFQAHHLILKSVLLNLFL